MGRLTEAFGYAKGQQKDQLCFITHDQAASFKKKYLKHKTTKIVYIYTRGYVWPNPGPGGWASILTFEGKEKVITGSVQQTTNNRLEIAAAIEGLRKLKEPCEVVIINSSEYLCDGGNTHLEKWVKGNYINFQGFPIANRDLWETIHLFKQTHKIKFKWVRSHAGVELNERCDLLAKEARLQAS